MTSETADQLELEIKRLERDKRIEEIRQLRASGRRQWITPTALAALLPLLAGLGLWIVGELKQYNEGFRALQERDSLRAEKQELQRQKDSLNIEVSTLLDLKQHYAAEAADLQAKFAERQALLDRSYLRARFASDEARYALSHIEGLGPGPDRAALDKLAQEAARLPPDSNAALGDLVERYELAIDMIEVSQETLEAFSDTLKLIPASDWAVELNSLPSGLILPGRNIMVSDRKRGGRMEKHYYDVDEGRFLTEQEVGPQ